MGKWKAVKLSDMFTLQMGKTPSRDNSAYWNGTHKWVSIADLGKAVKYITGIVKKSAVRKHPKSWIGRSHAA